MLFIIRLQTYWCTYVDTLYKISQKWKIFISCLKEKKSSMFFPPLSIFLSMDISLQLFSKPKKKLFDHFVMTVSWSFFFVIYRKLNFGSLEEQEKDDDDDDDSSSKIILLENIHFIPRVIPLDQLIFVSSTKFQSIH